LLDPLDSFPCEPDQHRCNERCTQHRPAGSCNLLLALLGSLTARGLSRGTKPNLPSISISITGCRDFLLHPRLPRLPFLIQFRKMPRPEVESTGCGSDIPKHGFESWGLHNSSANLHPTTRNSGVRVPFVVQNRLTRHPHLLNRGTASKLHA